MRATRTMVRKTAIPAKMCWCCMWLMTPRRSAAEVDALEKALGVKVPVVSPLVVCLLLAALSR